MGRKEPSRRSVGLRHRRLRGFSDCFRREILRTSRVGGSRKFGLPQTTRGVGVVVSGGVPVVVSEPELPSLPELSLQAVVRTRAEVASRRARICCGVHSGWRLSNAAAAPATRPPAPPPPGWW